METKRFSKIVKQISSIKKNLETDTNITGITYDSRLVKPGYLFVALPGLHTNGHFYIEDAIKRGASALIFESEKNIQNKKIPFLKVKNSRVALSKLAHEFYERPSQHLFIIGVTGTDGKSTTVYLIQQLLELLKEPSGFLSTVNYQINKKSENSPFRQSTPEAPELHFLLKQMVALKKRFAIIEATSHGLSSKTARLKDVLFDVGVFTNLSHEHLEFHGTLIKYRTDKANLFRCLGMATDKYDFFSKKKFTYPHFAILNRSDPHWKYFLKSTKLPCFTYGLEETAADISAVSIKTHSNGSEFIIKAKKQKLPALLNIPGTFNIENALAAILTVSRVLDVDLKMLVPLLPRLKGVKGRMHSIDMGQPFRVIVDFAHTPGAFKKLLPWLRNETKGRLICVFGSAGERDIDKRALQGKIASQHCDMIILTDEDPRQEDRMVILKDIAKGCKIMKQGKNLFLIPDRRHALIYALTSARANDTVLLLGKGHEKSIIYAEGPKPWNEIVNTKVILRRLGWG